MATVTIRPMLAWFTMLALSSCADPHLTTVGDNRSQAPTSFVQSTQTAEAALDLTTTPIVLSGNDKSLGVPLAQGGARLGAPLGTWWAYNGRAMSQPSSGFLSYGPDLTLAADRTYTAGWVFTNSASASDATAEDTVILHLDVIVPPASGPVGKSSVLASRNLKRSDFLKANTDTTFILTFKAPSDAARVELRAYAYYTNVSSLLIEKSVQYQPGFCLGSFCSNLDTVAGR